VTLTEEEKQEMLLDARDPTRRKAFAAARRASQAGTLDDYIEFLSENMSVAAASAPRITVSDDFRL
jgi:hypothetical protein